MKCKAALLAGRGEAACYHKGAVRFVDLANKRACGFLNKTGSWNAIKFPTAIAAVARSAWLLLEVFLSGFC